MLGTKTRSKISKHRSTILPLQDITPADDAFHGSPKRVATEWWYFDAIFDNNYSVHIGFPTFSRKKLGLAVPNIHIYKDGKLVAETRNRYLFRNFKTSKELPVVKLFNTTIIDFDQDKYKNNGEWVYHIKFKKNDNAIDLTFFGITKGWKIVTDQESWAVALPKASVTGEIIVNGKRMNVNGIGYHDHNWNYSLLSILNYGTGWYWGKLISDSFNLVWVNIVKSPKRSEILAIASKDSNGFFNIDPENIYFKIEKFTQINKRKIPSCFKLQIEDVVKDIPIKIDARMELKNIHYSTAFFTHYWRYHTNTSGFISIGNKKEQMNKIHIMEYMTLK
ncbi:MAG: hypothetical protein KAW45_05925 [Thermoplasmatales archaeon]|nr:hypothetical protein [Thermoplasmatales archaeon]